VTSRNLLGFLSLLSVLVFTGLIDRVYAQTPQVKDSLKNLLKKTTTAQGQADVLNALAYEYYDFNDSVALGYAKQAFVIAEQSNYLAGKKLAYTMIGIGHLSFGDYDLAIKNFRLSDQIPKSSNTTNDSYNSLQLAGTFTDMGQYDSAEKYYNNAIRLSASLPGRTDEHASSVYRGYAALRMLQWRNDEAAQLLTKAKSVLRQNNLYDEADFYRLYAQLHFNRNEYSMAESYAIKLCTISEKMDDNFHKASCQLLLAEISNAKGELSKALLHCFAALKLSKVYTYITLRAQIYHKIGDIYGSLGQYTIASEFFYKSFALTEKSGLLPYTAQAYSDFAWYLREQFNYPVALQFTDSAQKINERINNAKGIAFNHNNRGLIYLAQKKYRASITEQEHAMEILKTISAPKSISAAFFNLSLVYEELGELNKALDLQLKALELDEKIGNNPSLAITYNGVASINIGLGNSREAEKFLKKSYALASQAKSPQLLKDCYATYVKLYEYKKDYVRALAYHKLYQSVSDSVYSENATIRLAEMQALYQVERKEAEIVLLNRDRELNNNKMALQKMQLRNQGIIITIGSVLLILIVLFSIASVRSNRKILEAKRALAEANEELTVQSEELRESNIGLMNLNDQLIEKQEEIQAQAEELTESNNTLFKLNEDLQEKREEIEVQSEELREANETISNINIGLENKVEQRTQQLRQAYIELDTFFYRSSHDFRRPITTFMGLAEVAKITVKDDKALDLFAKVSETAHNLDKMLRKLQSISDVGAQDLIYKEVLLRELIANVVAGFQEEVNSKNIRITDDLKLTTPFFSYAALVKVALENVLENAIQFCGVENRAIKISAHQTTEQLVITVEDNGQGIPEEYHDRIFDMYFRANVTSKGNGLGLYITQKAVAKLNGSISFQSVLYEGSVFTIELPLNT
jgi:signal transduction histidine kinase